MAPDVRSSDKYSLDKQGLTFTNTSTIIILRNVIVYHTYASYGVVRVLATLKFSKRQKTALANLKVVVRPLALLQVIILSRIFML